MPPVRLPTRPIRMRSPLRFAATVLLALVVGAAAVPGARAQSTAIHTKVLEGAQISYDRASGVAVVAACRECPRLTLTVTERTEIILDGRTQPFTRDTEIAGLADTMYDTRDMTVVWFRPLGMRR
jgi:hypothetical protein